MGKVISVQQLVARLCIIEEDVMLCRKSIRWLLAFLVLSLLFVSSIIPAAADGLAPILNLELVGQIGGEITAAAVAGSTVYAGIGARLVALDVTDPANPHVLGQSPALSTTLINLVVARNYVYAAAGLQGVRVLDVSDASAIFEAGFLLPGGPGINDVAVVGKYVYAIDDSGLRVVDVSDPSAPVQVGFCPITPSVGGSPAIAAAGGIAYVANAGGELRIIDVTDPANPVEVGHLPGDNWGDGSWVADVSVEGQHAYLAARSAELRVVDVSDPTTPKEVGSFETQGRTWHVAATGGYAYIYDGYGIQIVSVANPAMPVKVESFELYGSLADLDAQDGFIYALDASGLRIIRGPDPGSTAPGGFYKTPKEAFDVVSADRYAYLGDADGLRVLDRSNPLAPFQVGFCDLPGSALGVTIIDGRAYVADDFWGLYVVDVSDPTRPATLGSYDTAEQAADVAVVGDYAFVVVGVADPSAPTLLASYTWTPDKFPNAVTVAGNYALVASGLGLRIHDIRPRIAPPVQVGLISHSWLARGVSASGRYAYVAAGSEGLRVIDVTGDGGAAQVGAFTSGWYAADVEVAGESAYVASPSDGGLHVIDVANPAAPEEVGVCPSSACGYAGDLAAQGGYLYTVDGLRHQ